MKQWMKKLVDQLDMDWGSSSSSHPSGKKPEATPLSEERATLLFLLDIYNKNLFEIQNHSVRKVRAKIDTFAKELVHPSSAEALNDTLFRFRQFFSSYRIDEYSFVQNTVDDFKRIIWDFADHLSEDTAQESSSENEMNSSLAQLREAVESSTLR